MDFRFYLGPLISEQRVKPYCDKEMKGSLRFRDNTAVGLCRLPNAFLNFPA